MKKCNICGKKQKHMPTVDYYLIKKRFSYCSKECIEKSEHDRDSKNALLSVLDGNFKEDKMNKKIEICDKCKKRRGYPYYGLAPHNHKFDEKGQIIIGSTEFTNKQQDNFIPDFEGSKMGVYFCEDINCRFSKENAMDIYNEIWGEK